MQDLANVVKIYIAEYGARISSWCRHNIFSSLISVIIKRILATRVAASQFWKSTLLIREKSFSYLVSLQAKYACSTVAAGSTSVEARRTVTGTVNAENGPIHVCKN